MLALWVLWNDAERVGMDYRARVWGYTGASGLVEALAAGYFAWDLWVSTVHLDVFGVGLLAHAVSAFGVYILGFVSIVKTRPTAFYANADIIKATLCAALCTDLHSLRAFLSLPQLPLVHGQTRHDWFECPTLQRHHPHEYLLRFPLGMGPLPDMERVQ